jgi:myo-inositol-1(or 4)-monophosphatase
MQLDAMLDVAVDAARGAAELLRAEYGNDAEVRSADGHDIKTQADIAAEAYIVDRIAPSGFPVLAEESAGMSSPNLSGMHWVVDPLDGTFNFYRGFDVCGVSVALCDGASPLLGVVVDIASGRLYHGSLASGAWLDNEPISVSAISTTAQAVLATGFPTARNYEASSLTNFVGQVQAYKKIRMIGSAALSLAFVASGVFDAYVEEDIMVWDVAAGLALVAAAGGSVRMEPGRSANTVRAVATNGHLALP